MLDKFKQLGDLKKMRDQAMQLKRQLASQEVVVEEDGIKVVMGGDQEVKRIEIDNEPQKKLVKALNKAVKKSQKQAARVFQKMGGGLSGLLGK